MAVIQTPYGRVIGLIVPKEEQKQPEPQPVTVEDLLPAEKPVITATPQARKPGGRRPGRPAKK